MLDASIPMGIRPVQIEEPGNAMLRALKVSELMDERRKYQKSLDDENALNAAYSGALGADGKIDQNKLYSLLATNNQGRSIPTVRKQMLEADEKQSKIEGEGVDRGIKKIAASRDLMFNINDPQTAARLVSQLHADPDMKSTIGKVSLDDLLAQIPGDPAGFAEWKNKFSLGAEKFMADLRQRQQLAETNRHNTTVEGETGRHNRASEGIQGGQLSETRRHNTTMEGFRGSEVGQGKTQIVETPQGFVIVDKNTGASRPAVGADGQPLKGKANDRVMTDAQAKANLFGTRMKESDRILSELEGKYMPGAVNAKMAAGEIPVVGGAAGYVGNLMLSESGQQAEQAQRDFINAVLRRESGAVISPQEFSNGQKQYFPQPGDSKAVLEQKRRNRALAISGMEAEVPGGFRTGPSLTNPGGNTGGATGDFGNGWKIEKVN